MTLQPRGLPESQQHPLEECLTTDVMRPLLCLRGKRLLVVVCGNM